MVESGFRARFRIIERKHKVPFDFAQGRLSARAKNALARDDKVFWLPTSVVIPSGVRRQPSAVEGPCVTALSF